jgi:LemA protein
MKLVKVLLILVLIVGVCVAGVSCYAVRGYNRVIAMDETVGGAWAQVESQLQRRYDLIPNLVETVKGFAAQEKEVFLGVAEARKAYTQAQSRPEKVAAAGMLESALSRLLVIQERYPDLKSNESFLKLQDSLEGTENRIAVERKRYNDVVRALNAYVRAFPGRLWASLSGVEQAEYFEVSEEAKATPKVDFTGDRGEAGSPGTTGSETGEPPAATPGG